MLIKSTSLGLALLHVKHIYKATSVRRCLLNQGVWYVWI